MAFLECHFFSESLGLSCSMNVILPQATRGQIGMKGSVRAKKHPVLWLLHGMSDDHTIWSRRTSIERYAADKGLAVIMPAANLSWYRNMAAGPAYDTFLGDELPAIARSFFPLSEDPADNFVAGLSMGGYGAFHLALTRPQNYAAAASLSGALDVARHAGAGDKHWQTVMKSVFGNPKKLRDTDADLLHLATELVRSKNPRPLLYACCGKDDFLLDGNRHFVAHAKKIKLPVLYEEHTGFAHSWDYWDRQIAYILDWLPIR